MSVFAPLLAQAAEAAGETEFNLRETLDPGFVKDWITDDGLGFVQNLVVAIAILMVGRWVARRLTGLAIRAAARSGLDETLSRFLQHVVYALLLTFVVLAALEQLGIDTTSLAAVIAAAGLAVGLALQGSLSNFAAGVMIVFFKPFQVGDFVETGGKSGVVEEIQIFSTLLRTGDNIQIIIPNSAVTSATITNFSAESTRRINLVVSCGYNDDLRAVRQFLEHLIAADDRILDDPAPVVAVNELAASSVDFVVRPWVRSEDYWTTRCDLTEAVKLGFDEHGFTIPYPSHDVHLHDSSSAA